MHMMLLLQQPFDGGFEGARYRNCGKCCKFFRFTSEVWLIAPISKPVLSAMSAMSAVANCGFYVVHVGGINAKVDYEMLKCVG